MAAPRTTDDAESSIWQAMRSAAAALADDVVGMFAVSAVWLAIALLVLFLGRWHVGLNLLLVLLVPITSGLGRMAASTARERRGRLAQVRPGVMRRWRTKLLLGASQLAIWGLTWLNVQVGLAARTTGLAIAALASVNVAVVVTAVATACWPLLLDPRRDHIPTRQLLRLGASVVAVRPGRMAALLVVGLLFVVVSLQTLVGALALVPLGVLLAAHTVVPVADRLAPPDGTAQP